MALKEEFSGSNVLGYVFATPLTQNSVPFVDANGKLAQDNVNLSWDDALKKVHLKGDTLEIGTVVVEDMGGCLATKEFHAHGRDGVSGYLKIKQGTTPSAHAEANHSILWVNSSEKLILEKVDGTDFEIIAADEYGITTFPGKVGIGIDTPTELIHVKSVGGNTLQYGLKLQNPYGATSEGATGILFQVATTTDPNSEKGGIAFERTKTYGRGKIHFLLNDELNTDSVDLTDAIMTLTSGGGVGIGTPSPGGWFVIEKDGSALGFVELKDTVGGGEFWINNGNASAGGAGYAGFYYGGAQRMSFEASTGYVGIGTTTPSEKLDVAGNIKLTGDLKTGATFEINDGTRARMTIDGGSSLFTSPGGGNSIGVTDAYISTSYKMRVGNGSAASPSFCFNAQENLGMYRKGSNQLGFSVSGAECMYFDTSGTVYIPSVYIFTVAESANVNVTNGGLLRKITSSRKIKKDIDYNGVNPELALNFKPVSFDAKADGRHYMGFISEDMRDIDARFATAGGEEDLPGLEMNAIVAALTSLVQEQQKQIDELKMAS